jgi:hypothetical protein
MTSLTPGYRRYRTGGMGSISYPVLAFSTEVRAMSTDLRCIYGSVVPWIMGSV